MRKNGLTRDEAKNIVYMFERRKDSHDENETIEIHDGAAVLIDVEKITADRWIKNPSYLTYVNKNSGRLFHVSRDDPKANADVVVLEEDDSQVKWLFRTEDLIPVGDGKDES